MEHRYYGNPIKQTYKCVFVCVFVHTRLWYNFSCKGLKYIRWTKLLYAELHCGGLNSSVSLQTWYISLLNYGHVIEWQLRYEKHNAFLYKDSVFVHSITDI